MSVKAILARTNGTIKQISINNLSNTSHIKYVKGPVVSFSTSAIQSLNGFNCKKLCCVYQRNSRKNINYTVSGMLRREVCGDAIFYLRSEGFKERINFNLSDFQLVENKMLTIRKQKGPHKNLKFSKGY